VRWIIFQSADREGHVASAMISARKKTIGLSQRRRQFEWIPEYPAAERN